MITFLHPLWLIGSAAIAAPILIHLWNIRQGRTLKVGSTALISDQSSRAKKIRVSEWLLLILRCCLILLTAALLAAPAWKNDRLSAKGWVLIDPNFFRESYGAFRQPIDSLLKAGYELHAFDTAFNKIVLADSASIAINEGVSYPILLNALSKKLPANLPIALFTPDDTRLFEGRHRPVSANLTWRRFTRTAAPDTARAAAWITLSDSLKVQQRISAATGNRIQTRLRASRKTDYDQGAMTVAVAGAAESPDLRYVAAALSAISSFSDRAIVPVHMDPKIPYKNPVDCLFWLSGEEIPGWLRKQTKWIFRYANGRERVVNSGIVVPGSEQVLLLKRYDAPASGIPLWLDADGEPVLTLSKTNDHAEYVLCTRLAPSYCSLAWNPQFPALLLGLLDPPAHPGNTDRRSYRFAYSPACLPAGAVKPPASLASLSTLTWLFLAALLAAERFISSKRVA